MQCVAPFAGAADAVVCEHHAYGGAGAAKLGEAVVAACKQPVDFKFLYDLKQPIKVRLYHAVSPLHKCCIVKTELRISVGLLIHLNCVQMRLFIS